MHLCASGELSDEDLFEINDLYIDLNLPQMSSPEDHEAGR
jgi:hypothetical protein